MTKKQKTAGHDNFDVHRRRSHSPKFAEATACRRGSFQKLLVLLFAAQCSASMRNFGSHPTSFTQPNSSSRICNCIPTSASHSRCVILSLDRSKSRIRPL